jgi:hypothetical protein
MYLSVPHTVKHVFYETHRQACTKPGILHFVFPHHNILTLRAASLLLTTGYARTQQSDMTRVCVQPHRRWSVCIASNSLNLTHIVTGFDVSYQCLRMSRGMQDRLTPAHLVLLTTTGFGFVCGVCASSQNGATRLERQMAYWR